MTQFGPIDWGILIVYFCAMAAIGPWFARRNKSTESYFLGNRSFPAWLLGLAMFATSISSVTVVAFPADAYKTAYLRLLPNLMLPVGILVASLTVLPVFRRSKCTSAFEYLEDRFGPGIRGYVSVVFLLGQIMRISTILYLVSLVFQQMTGYSPYVCIFAGGIVIAIYTVSGGIKAIVTTQFIQAFLLWTGAFLCLYMVIQGIEGGIPTIIKTAAEDGKFMLGDLNMNTKQLEPAPWFSLRDKAILMMLVLGFTNFLTEYSSNQNVIQKYVAAKNPREATKSVWICCFCSIPTWAFFMFLGTSLYVFFKLNPDPLAKAILTGEGNAKAESILPYFCTHHIPTGISGLVVTGVLSAAMSASASSLNAISAISVTDIYRRHMVKNASEKHYVYVARFVTAISAVVMIFGAVLFLNLSTNTLQDTGTKIASLLLGGIAGIYMIGFLTNKGNAKAVGIGIFVTVLFSLYVLAGDKGWIRPEWFMSAFGLSEGVAKVVARPLHIYYVGIFGNLVMFSVVYFVSALFLPAKRDLKNLTIWTKEPEEGEESATEGQPA